MGECFNMQRPWPSSWSSIRCRIRKLDSCLKQLAMSSFNTLLRPVVQLVGVSEDTHLEDGELPSPLVSENHEDFVSLVEL